MDEAAVRAALRRHWEFAGQDEDVSHDIYHDDAILEFPQSQERFVGKQNFLAWRKLYPAKLAFRMRRLRGQGDFWVAENAISYDGGAWNPTVSLLEFRGDKIARETIYNCQTWEPPASRAAWRADWVPEE